MKQPAANPFTRAALSAALSAHRAGKLQDAEAQYLKILKASPHEFDALSMLGALRCQRHDFAGGLSCLRAALKQRPHSPTLLLNLGQCLQALENFEEALGVFEKGLAIQPGAAAFLRGRAFALYRLGHYATALLAYEQLESLGQAASSDRINHGLCLYERQRFDEALAKLSAAAALEPENAGLHYNMGRCLLKLCHYPRAEQSFDKALARNPGDAKSLTGKTEAVRAQNDSSRALASIEQLLIREPENAVAKAFKATLLLDLNQKEQAAEIYRDLARRNQQMGEALFGLSQCKSFSSRDHDAELILNGGNLAALPPAERALVKFGISKCCDDLGQYDEAFAAAMEARNALPLTPQVNFMPSEIITAFPHGLNERHAPSGNGSRQPVFVIGMPRSGTSLIEQIIASHPQASGVGELEEMPRVAKELGFTKVGGVGATHWTGEQLAASAGQYLETLTRISKDSARIVDKLPHNFLFAGLIRTLFPNAKIIHVRRDPIDTCLSIFLNNLQGIHSYANDLASLGKYYVEYVKLMEHWRSMPGTDLYTCHYEKLVTDPEEQVRALITHLELPWDGQCLRFFDTHRTVSTFSRGQVRQPLYARSIGRWKNYEKHLEPLLTELRRGLVLD